MLLQSLLLVLFLKCFAITAAANDAKAAFKLSSLTKPFETTLKTAKPKQQNGWWSQGTPFGPRGQQTKVTKEKTSKDGEKSENPFHKIHSNFAALEGFPSAAPRRGRNWNGFENIASRGADGSKILKNEGEHGLARPRSSLKHVVKTGDVSMVTDGQDIEMATPAVNNNKRKPVKGEDKKGMKEQHGPGHDTFTITTPWDGGKTRSQEERSGTLEVTLQQPHSSHLTQDQHPLKISVNSGKAQEAFPEDSGTTTKNNVGLKGTDTERFRVRERVKEKDVNVSIWDRKAEMKAEKMVVWENGKIEERTREQQKTVDGRIDGDKKGEQMIMGNQVVVEKMRKQEMLVGERTKGDKESKRMILGGFGERKEGARDQEVLVGEGTKGGKEGKRSARIKGFEKGERMIAGRLSETNEGMKIGGTNRKERKGEEVMTGENMKTRDRTYTVGDHDDVTIGFVRYQNGWIPSWVIKARSRGGKKERKIGNVVHIEMKKEREMKGFNMGSN